jgi:HAD superfamily phosphoserine phosphatase-like hydrolase
MNAIPRAHVAAIEARMEAEIAQLQGPVVASDADGTIWDGDVGFDLFEALLAAKGAREEAREALAAEALSIGVRPEGSAHDLTVALYDAYQRDAYPHDRAFAMMAWAFAGWAPDELSAFCAQNLADRRIEARIRPELLRLFRFAEARGVPVYVVSASPRAVVEAAAPHLGIPRERLVAMTPALGADGRVLPRLDGPIVYGEGKLAALAKARPAASGALLAAFGDSAYDAAMLRAARIPVAVTPAPALVALAPTIPGLVELHR